MPTFAERLSNAWNAFRNKNPSEEILGQDYSAGPVSSYRPDRKRVYRSTDQTIAAAIYNRIATDVSASKMQHIRVDYMGGFLEEIDSGLNRVLTLEANTDQTGTELLRDITLSMLDEGVVAAVPIDTSRNPRITDSFDILSMRTGKIVGWQPQHVKLEVYNERNGQREFLYLAKNQVAIIENPFYSIMNEPNSTLQRLIRKLALLDHADEVASSGKLDLIIQLPYVVKSETRKDQAEKRRKDIEDQLANSTYGIAYIDGTERITQLNRAVENNLLSQIEYLTRMLYSQLGIDQEILGGTANEQAMLNYYQRTVDVILAAIRDEFQRKFLTKTAYTQGQRIRYYRDPFSLTPTNEIADLADKFTRNEILTPNEVRGIVGFKPSEDPKADELRNRNINQSDQELMNVSGNQNEGEMYEV